MDSKEKLEQLLITNPQAAEKFKKITKLSKEEIPHELHKLEKEFDILLNPDDFESSVLSEEQLEHVAGGNDVTDVIGVIGTIFTIYPPSTGRGTKSGTKRFK